LDQADPQETLISNYAPQTLLEKNDSAATQALQSRRKLIAAGSGTAALLLIGSLIWLNRPVNTGDGGGESPKAVEPVKVVAAPPLAIAPFNAAQARAHQLAWAKHLGVPVEKDVDIGDSVKITMVLIPQGEFLMGSSDEERTRRLKKATAARDRFAISLIPGEGPQHRVRLTKPFYLAVHEVTQEQYQQVMGANPSHFSSSGKGKEIVASRLTHRHPVESVSWFDAVSFCNKLSALRKRRPCYVTSGIKVTQISGNGYRLPTEAEWEYACRAGSTGAYGFADESELDNYAWYHVNSAGMTHPVGDKPPNGFGAYDMHGNVWEWCWDWHDAKSYEQINGVGDVVDPLGPVGGSLRVRRGGCWLDRAGRCRSACRRDFAASRRYSYLGFRLVMTIDAAKLKTSLTQLSNPDRTPTD